MHALLDRLSLLSAAQLKIAAITGCIAAIIITEIIRHMDFAFLKSKIDEAAQAVANAFSRTAAAEQAAQAGQPTAQELQDAATQLQAIIDAANSVAPDPTAAPAA